MLDLQPLWTVDKAGAGHITGLTLQSYIVPQEAGTPGDLKQVRLYMTITEHLSGNGLGAGLVKMVRVNINAIDQYKGAKPVSDLERFGSQVMVANPAFPATAVARLAYAQGKVYYLSAPMGKGAVLAFTDVAVAVECAPAMGLLAPSFQNWPVSEAQLGKAEDATPHTSKIEFLRETSPLVAGLPWEFKAYRKVVKFNGMLVSSTKFTLLHAAVCVEFGHMVGVAAGY